MLTLRGTLLNIFTSSDYTNKETNEVTKGKTKLQLLVKVPLKNGGYKNTLYDLTIPSDKLAKYTSNINKEVDIEVGVIGEHKFYGI
ncbi:MAG: hypothetical protein PHE60_10735 [Sulfurospirillaceae bacterium]|nr:hypothetical protein [Sulfurospirillaceae bacterium]